MSLSTNTELQQLSPLSPCYEGGVGLGKAMVESLSEDFCLLSY